MNKISRYLEQDHRGCDDQYTMAEAEVARRQWESARTEFTRFTAMFERHLDKEDRVLFPLIDRMLGTGSGATNVMRSEHTYMRATIIRMARTLISRDSNGFFDEADALRKLMRQHHLKEEAVLYPMADRLLHGCASEVMARMDDIDTRAGLAGVA